MVGRAITHELVTKIATMIADLARTAPSSLAPPGRELVSAPYAIRNAQAEEGRNLSNSLLTAPYEDATR